MKTGYQRLQAVIEEQDKLTEDFIEKAFALMTKLGLAYREALSCDEFQAQFLDLQPQQGELVERELGGGCLLSARGFEFAIRTVLNPRFVDTRYRIVPGPEGVSVETEDRTVEIRSDDDLKRWADGEVDALEAHLQRAGVNAAIAAKALGKKLPERNRR